MIAAPQQPRWWKFVKRRRLACPHGHHIPATVRIPESGFIRCAHWIDGEKRECGRWVFVYAIRGGRAVVAEVELAEQDEMEDLATPAEMIDFLGIFGSPSQD